MMRLMKTIFVVLVLVLAFQNCSRVDPSVLFGSPEKSQATADSGIPYEGKIYVVSGALCPDGTAIQARLVMKSATSAELNRRDCKDISPLLLSDSDFKFDSQNTLVYQNSTFTAWSPSSIGVGFGTLPKLVSPVDPTAYGAKGDGVTDNTTAFTSALAAGDLLIPAGTYLIQGTIKVPAGRNIQCVSPATVHIINPLHSTVSNHMFQFWSTAGSISNCHLSGSSDFNANGSAAYDSTMDFNYLVTIVDYRATVSQIKVVNNIFDNCHGNACLAVYGESPSGAGAYSNSIIYNTFQTCAMAGVYVDAGVDTLVAYNYATDCSLMVSNGAATSPNSNNILEYNSIRANVGTGVAFNLGSYTGTLVLTGGQSGGANYSSNIVRNNTLIGNGLPNSVSLETRATYPAQYYNNSCTNGCTVH